MSNAAQAPVTPPWMQGPGAPAAAAPAPAAGGDFLKLVIAGALGTLVVMWVVKDAKAKAENELAAEYWREQAQRLNDELHEAKALGLGMGGGGGTCSACSHGLAHGPLHVRWH